MNKKKIHKLMLGVGAVCTGLVAFVASGSINQTNAQGFNPVTFYVNSTLDEVDSNIGDGYCLTASGVCTLRAAVQEANFDQEYNNIDLGLIASTTNIGNTITLNSGNGENNSATGDLDITSPMGIYVFNNNLETVNIESPLDDRVFDIYIDDNEGFYFSLNGGEVIGRRNYLVTDLPASEEGELIRVNNTGSTLNSYVTIENLTLKNAIAQEAQNTDFSSVVQINGSNNLISNVTFKDNDATNMIDASLGTISLNISGSSFITNNSLPGTIVSSRTAKDSYFNGNSFIGGSTSSIFNLGGDGADVEVSRNTFNGVSMSDNLLNNYSNANSIFTFNTISESTIDPTLGSPINPAMFNTYFMDNPINGSLTLGGNIIYNNNLNGLNVCESRTGASVNNLGYSFIQDESCNPTDTDSVNIDPMLGTPYTYFANNYSYRHAYPLLSNSPVVDSIPDGELCRFDGYQTDIHNNITPMGNGCEAGSLEVNNIVTDLSITKIADKESVKVGDRITYTITINNNGNYRINNAVVSDYLMEGFVEAEVNFNLPENENSLSFFMNPSGGRISENGFVEANATLYPNNPLSFTISGIVEEVYEFENITNVASVDYPPVAVHAYSNIDPEYGNNIDDAIVDVTREVITPTPTAVVTPTPIVSAGKTKLPDTSSNLFTYVTVGGLTTLLGGALSIIKRQIV